MKGRPAVVKFVHAISSCARDLEPYPISETDLISPEAAGAWIKKCTGVSVSLAGARRTECGGWVFFPRSSIWWSVSVRLDVEQAQAEAAACTCRNHRVLS